MTSERIFGLRIINLTLCVDNLEDGLGMGAYLTLVVCAALVRVARRDDHMMSRTRELGIGANSCGLADDVSTLLAYHSCTILSVHYICFNGCGLFVHPMRAHTAREPTRRRAMYVFLAPIDLETRFSNLNLT